MYERSYGYRYRDLGEHPTPAAIAAAMRADVKTAQSEGLLPTRWTYSVRSKTFAGGCSVDVDVRDCEDAWRECDGGQGCRNVWCAARNDPRYAHAAKRHIVLTDEAEAAKMTLERIHNAYNHNGSEIQVDYFDVRYYGHVEFESPDAAAWRRKEAERLAARKAARESGRIVGKVANYGRDGRAVVHLIVETDDGRQSFGCGARMMRYGLRQRVDDDAGVTCSRCAKRSARS